MQGYNVDESTTRVRWVLAGQFSLAGEKRWFQVDKNSFADELTKAQLAPEVSVADRIGSDATRSYTVALSKLKDFKLESVVANVPELSGLAELAAKIGKSSGPTPDTLIGAVVDRFGRGRLAAELVTLFAADAPAAADAKPTPVADPGISGIDAIFASAGVKTVTEEAKSSIDTFIAAVRDDSKSFKSAGKALRNARDLIEDTVYATARDLLIADEVHRLESAWRGLDLVLNQTPSSKDVAIIVLDGPVEDALEGLNDILPDDPFDYPDAVFFIDPCDDIGRLGEIGEALADLNIAGVAAVSDRLFGDGPSFAEAAKSIDDLRAGAGAAWSELCAAESSRWLSVVVNRVVLYAEGVGAAKRVVLGSPAFAAAAMLTQSYRTIGAFGHVIGNPGAINAPAVWTMPGEREETMLPLEAFVSIRTQSELSTLGISALGSGRNSDRVVLSQFPAVRLSKDAVPLPAQIHTGKIIRFAIWVTDQVTPGMDADALRKLYEEAASVFLFGHLHADAVQLTAQLLTEPGGRQVRVSAQMAPALAGVHLVIVFALPIP